MPNTFVWTLPRLLDTQIKHQFRTIGVAEVLVVVSRPAAPAPARGPSKGRAGRSGAAAVVGSVYQRLSRYFMVSERSQRSALARAASRAPSGRAGSGRRPVAPAVQHYPTLGVMLGTVDEEGLAGLEADRAVKVISGVGQLRPIWPERSEPARLTVPRTWGLDRLRVPALWAQGLSGAGVLVGHLDTGVDPAHPALADAVAHFLETDMMGLPLPARTARDTGLHGTHTAGTVVGRPVHGRHIGVAPGARLASAIVIEGGEIVARLLAGLDWALRQKVRIVNLSLGLPGYLEDFLPIVAILRDRNVLPIVAIGNEGPGTSRSPGNYMSVLSVGAMDARDRVAFFSSSQQFNRADPLVPDLVAPGVGVLSAGATGGYYEDDGSSMAAPHVSGLAALLLEAKPTATVDELEAAIFASCSLPAGMPRERAGRGVPDAVAAFTALTGIALEPAGTKKRTATGTARRTTTGSREARRRTGERKK